jgi:predicted tellurium resistance membrane protein TerC
LIFGCPECHGKASCAAESQWGVLACGRFAWLAGKDIKEHLGTSRNIKEHHHRHHHHHHHHHHRHSGLVVSIFFICFPDVVLDFPPSPMHDP